jgi:predicted Zn-dependent protease
MQKKTYLQESIKGGRLMRWNMMPLKVSISPMKFYSKQGQDLKYRHFVKQALDEWHKVSNGKVSFVVVDNLLSSNVNIEWQRVQRQALGHCIFQYDRANRLYSAEVMIGLTEGLVHADYNNEGEIYHTILHEIGHAIGLGHSPYKTDIMYTPHQKGIHSVSAGDVETVNWLYKLPQGATPKEIASRYNVT